jgi:L-ascorbate metabolism protein UlaG (beta-lactamase superfamily)
MANRCEAAIYGSPSAKNVAIGGGVTEDRIVVFQDGSEYSIGGYKIRILKSLHSKPTILNNDLGQPIEEPLVQPASLRDYKEGGSYDFFIEHGNKKILIRPSFNYIKGQLDGIQTDILFLGVAGLAKADETMEKEFFSETVEKTNAKLVIPVHWDNFFSSLEKPTEDMPAVIEKTDEVFFKLGKFCENNDVNCLIQYPCTSMEITQEGDIRI